MVAAVLLAVVMQVWVRPMLGDFHAKILLDIVVNVVLAVSLTIVNGFTGQFSIGHAAFMAVGGYTAAGIVYYGSYKVFGDPLVHGGTLSTMVAARGFPLLAGGDVLFAASLVAGGLVAAVCGYIVGLPSLRLKGDYLAIVTLGFGEIVRVLIQSQTTDVLYEADEIAATAVWKLPRYLGGALGFSGLPFYTSLFWAFLVAGITLIVAYRLKVSSYGRAFLSVREDEVAAEAMGVNTTRYKVWAFVIAAFFAGVAGGLFAHTSGVQLNAGELAFQKSFDIIIMVVLGGLGSFSGAMIAAAIVTVLPELLRKPGDLAAMWPYALAIAGVAGVAWLISHRRGRVLPFVKGLTLVGVVALGIAGIAAVAAVRGWDLGKYRMVIFALALILMMILRPQGLLGVREIWDKALWRRGGRERRVKGGAAAGKGAP